MGKQLSRATNRPQRKITKTEYRRRKAVLKAYLMLRFDMEDYHGIWDVAIDLAILKAQYEAS